MRYLIDTNIIVYMIGDPDLLDNDVKAIMEEPDTLLYASTESAKELVVAYRNKGLFSKRWKSPEDMLHSIENEYFIEFLPVQKEHILTYSRMEINEVQCHKDPSDHVIIAHAMTERLPLISSDTRFEFYRRQGLDLVFNKK
ncbi:MAG: type II toxin-antitoxin system VapC family toxin [Bacteroidales bacterium]|nr:type II toxin-antitoxin system VapC family toxin [Bacteroidales bacterium]